MDKKETNNLEILRAISLQESERAMLYSKLSEYADFLPLREKAKKTRTTSFYFFSRHIVGAILVPVFVILVSGGISFFAESALPGDSLYSFKTNVNEQIQGVFAFSAGEKAAFRNALIEKRIEEAERLGINDAFTDFKKEILSQEINKQTVLLEKDLLSLGVEDTKSATVENMKLAARLDAYNEAINIFLPQKEAAVAEAGEAYDQETEALSVLPVPPSVEQTFSISESTMMAKQGEGEPSAATSAVQEDASLERSFMTEDEAESFSLRRFEDLAIRKQEELRQKLDEVTEKISVYGESFSADFAEQIRTELKKILNLQNKGHREYENKNYGEAYLEYQKALRQLRDIEIQLSRFISLLK